MMSNSILIPHALIFTFYLIPQDDVPFGQILAAFDSRTGTDDNRAEIAAYCLQDGYLCLKLLQKWSTHTSLLEEAACCVVNASSVLDSGRQIKVISLILAEIYDEFVYNPPVAVDDGEGYAGATVIDTVPGYYSGPDDQVILGDFASLYPSLMRAHNVCPSRYIRAEKSSEVKAALEPGVVVTDHVISDALTVRLAMPTSGSKAPFTKILEKLLAERAAVRKLQKLEQDPVKKSILNCRQLSRKVSCNSAYGLLGSKTGYLSLPPLAAVTTYTGRMALQFSQKVIEEEFGGFTVAGDTGVCISTPAFHTIHWYSLTLLFATFTDSVMFQLPAVVGIDTIEARMEYVFSKGAEICDIISSRLPGPLEFELEGVLWPACYYKKKCYVAQSWEQWEQPQSKLKFKGICAVRNDRSKLNKRIANEVLNISIRQGDAQAAINYLISQVSALRQHKIPLGDFVLSKNLKTLTPASKSPHVELVRRLAPVDRPVLGSKVEYVITAGGRNSELSDQSMRPQDTTVAAIDTKWYFETQILKPICELVGPILGEGGEGTLMRLLCNEFNLQRTLAESYGIADVDVKGQAKKKQKTEVKVQSKGIKSYFSKK